MTGEGREANQLDRVEMIGGTLLACVLGGGGGGGGGDVGVRVEGGGVGTRERLGEKKMEGVKRQEDTTSSSSWATGLLWHGRPTPLEAIFFGLSSQQPTGRV